MKKGQFLHHDEVRTVLFCFVPKETSQYLAKVS